MTELMAQMPANERKVVIENKIIANDKRKQQLSDNILIYNKDIELRQKLLNIKKANNMIIEDKPKYLRLQEFHDAVFEYEEFLEINVNLKKTNGELQNINSEIEGLTKINNTLNEELQKINEELSSL
jgi:hypothetical protein